MSAPLRPKTCEIGNSYCQFGSETLSKLLQAFKAQIEGVIESKDIEYVHRMRVSSRRLRAAMPLFRTCYPKKKFKKWLGEVKKVTTFLGEARDLDVQIAFIQAYSQELKSPTESAGLEPMLKSHKNRRKAIQATVTGGLEELKDSAMLEEMGEFWEQTAEELAKVPFDASPVLEKAYWHISSRLNDFLALEEYVHQESAILKHHEMRIKAKWLRYTMEVFAPLYKNKLAEEIQTTKDFQDVLGEMHDSDVWIDYIPKFIDEAKAKTKAPKKADVAKVERALLNFLVYIKEKRKEQYSQFVHLWDENKKKGFFDQLRITTNIGFAMTEEKTKQILAKTHLKIGVLADVHANLQALERVLQDAEERGVDVFLNAGDSVGFGPCPNEVVELLCEKNVLNILGNYDLEVIEGKAKAKGEKNIALKFTRKELAKSCEDYLFSLPRELRLEVTGKNLLLIHGSPESIEEHIYHNTPVERLKTLADAAKADIVIVGHSHEQFRRQVNGVLFINPGSVGRPGDGNPQTAYAMLSFDPFLVELIRLNYDVTAAADALRKKALPESFSQMVLRGVSLDAIVEEDRSKEEYMVQNCKAIVEASQKISKTYWQDTEHYTQVTKLSLKFFDELIKVHKLGERERCWLECAAILHDVGMSKGRCGHHKESAKLILNDTQLPFTSQERRTVASIARYHRNGLPKQSHYNLATLGRKTVQKVKILASLLRVADGLDYTHQSIVKSLNIKVGTKRFTVECVCETESMLEEQAFNKKKDLFEKVFARKLVLVWKRQ
jgi:putative phosphoesterase